MSMPLALIKAQDATAIWVCDKLSVEEWCRAYVDSGVCVRDWAYLHAMALNVLKYQPRGGTCHGFAGNVEGDADEG